MSVNEYTYVFLSRDDFKADLHPFFFEELCEQLGLDRDCHEIELRVYGAKGDKYMEEV